MSADPDGHIKVNEDEGVNIFALTYFYGDRHAFPLTWDPPSVLNHELRDFVEKFVQALSVQSRQ